MLATIGLEVHVHLKTRSKMFCGCAVEFGAPPNSLTCPVCLGMPGALPVMNHEALRLTTLAGLMLECEIAPICKFDRKNYFYPDLAKNYQITQYDLPLCLKGRLVLPDLAYPRDAGKGGAPEKQIGLTRIHLEEDVAKSFHFPQSTGIDFNRAGTPLMEIVTEPEINSPEEAFAFLSALKQLLEYGQISDADMEKGQLRCDCNISVRATADEPRGAKVEIKNMNSISGVRRALAFEIERQRAALSEGRKLSQETRGWDDSLGQTFVMRTKESAHDYRYFPDPDLMPVRTDELLREARAALPERPDERRERLVSAYGITPYDAAVLASDRPLAAFFETAAAGSSKAKAIANWIINDFQSALGASGRSLEQSLIKAEALRELVELIASGRISANQGKEVFAEMFASGAAPGLIVRARGLEQLSNSNAIEALCDQVIAANPKPVADFKAGHAASLNFLKGQVMKLSQGKANPQLVGEALERKLVR